MIKNNMTEKNKQISENPGPIWKPYIGREVSFEFTNSTVMGVLRGVNVASNYVEFMPSIVSDADDKHLYLEKHVPTIITLPLIETGKYIIRPLRDGYLEARVKHLNNQVDKVSVNIGFSAASE